MSDSVSNESQSLEDTTEIEFADELKAILFIIQGVPNPAISATSTTSGVKAYTPRKKLNGAGGTPISFRLSEGFDALNDQIKVHVNHHIRNPPSGVSLAYDDFFALANQRAQKTWPRLSPSNFNMPLRRQWTQYKGQIVVPEDIIGIDQIALYKSMKMRGFCFKVFAYLKSRPTENAGRATTDRVARALTAVTAQHPDLGAVSRRQLAQRVARQGNFDETNIPIPTDPTFVQAQHVDQIISDHEKSLQNPSNDYISVRYEIFGNIIQLHRGDLLRELGLPNFPLVSHELLGALPVPQDPERPDTDHGGQMHYDENETF
jgi:hypothetical protein